MLFIEARLGEKRDLGSTLSPDRATGPSSWKTRPHDTRDRDTEVKVVTPPAMLDHGRGQVAFRGFAVGLAPAPVLRGWKAISEGVRRRPQVDERP